MEEYKGKNIQLENLCHCIILVVKSMQIRKIKIKMKKIKFTINLEFLSVSQIYILGHLANCSMSVYPVHSTNLAAPIRCQ